MMPLFRRLSGSAAAELFLAGSTASAEFPEAEYSQPPPASIGGELTAAQPNAPAPIGPTWEQYQSLVERPEANERKIAECRVRLLQRLPGSIQRASWLTAIRPSLAGAAH